MSNGLKPDTVKQSLLVVFLSITAQLTFAQGLNFWNRCGDTFDQRLYSIDSFAVQRQSFKLGHTQIVITLLHCNFEKEDQIWLEQRKRKRILHSKYLGWIGSGENGVALPKEQKLKDLFIIKYASEFTGIYYLIDKTGKWYEIPGGIIILKEQLNTLYTFVSEECGGCEIGKFSLNTRKLTTKFSDGIGVAWKEVTDKTDYLNLFEHNEWIKWITL